MRRIASLLLLVGLGASSVACAGDAMTAEDRVKAALAKTFSQPRSFIYQEQGIEADVIVRGVIQDDYRYKARVTIEGEEAIDEVAVDDALAVRFLEPEAVTSYLRQGGPASPPSLETLNLLQSRHWVVDPTGAPDLTAPGLQRLRVGQDHVLDALTVSAYVDKALQEAEEVARFNPEAIDYIEREDHFPKPEQGSPVVRYDVKPPEIPPFAGGGTTLPEVRHFRKMSIYIRGGEVIQMMEEIDLASRYDRLVEALDLEIPGGLSGGQRLAFAVDALNQLRTTRRSEPIRIRRMSLEIIDLGEENLIELPADAAVGSLAFLPNRGRGAGAATEVNP